MAASARSVPWAPLGVGRRAAELARKDRAFRMASLRMQYPK